MITESLLHNATILGYYPYSRTSPQEIITKLSLGEPGYHRLFRWWEKQARAIDMSFQSSIGACFDNKTTIKFIARDSHSVFYLHYSDSTFYIHLNVYHMTVDSAFQNILAEVVETES